VGGCLGLHLGVEQLEIRLFWVGLCVMEGGKEEVTEKEEEEEEEEEEE
jgi:hypothetical protein